MVFTVKKTQTLFSYCLSQFTAPAIPVDGSGSNVYNRLQSSQLLPCAPWSSTVYDNTLSTAPLFLNTFSTLVLHPTTFSSPSANCPQFLINYHDCTTVSAINWAIPNYCSCLPGHSGSGRDTDSVGVSRGAISEPREEKFPRKTDGIPYFINHQPGWQLD